jgi:hypothetical protein
MFAQTLRDCDADQVALLQSQPAVWNVKSRLTKGRNGLNAELSEAAIPRQFKSLPGKIRLLRSSSRDIG